MNLQHRHPLSHPSSSRELHIAFRGSILVLLLTAFLLYRFLLPKPDPLCIYDAYQSATLTANRQLVLDPTSAAYEGNSNMLNTAGQAFIGTGQVMMDLWIAIFGLIWLAKVKNVRGFAGLGGFFLTRGLIFLNISKFPYPDNLVWRSPGFFSFTVPYDHTRDFFYSGHTGTLTAIFLELFLLKFYWVAGVAFLCLIFMMNMLLITQVHYVCDIVGGLVFAAWFHRMATRGAYWLDKALSLPFWTARWIYRNKCKQYCIEEKEGSTDQGNQANGNKDRNGNGEGRGTEGRFYTIEIQSRKSLEGITGH